MSPQTLKVALGVDSYEIHIGAGILAQAGKILSPVLASNRVIIVADEALQLSALNPLANSLQAAGLLVQSVTMPSGEASKSFAGFEALLNQLLALNPDRKTTLIALGGGVIGDLVGFAASVLLRGVPFVQVPTTLLAQVDSSVGGKTGINTATGKNMVGSFYQPLCVLIDTSTLATLPARQMRAGYAEIVKYAALGDASFFVWLEAHGEAVLRQEREPLTHAIAHCCRMKADIVAQDEKEAGKRALLNLGHTFGHALEAEAGYDDRLMHGEAVAIGMLMAARLSHRLGLCSAEAEARLLEHLKACGLPCSPKAISGVLWNASSIASHFASDKKAESGKLVFVLLRAIGDAMIMKDVDAKLALSVVEEFV